MSKYIVDIHGDIEGDYEIIKKYEEQQPCDDAISRQAVDDAIYDYSRACDVDYAQIMEYIDKLPSVNSQEPKWIPVSERLPEEESDVLVCNANGDVEISRGSYSTELKKEFIWYTSGWRFGKVTAWMPLPEPYKENEG